MSQLLRTICHPSASTHFSTPTLGEQDCLGAVRPANSATVSHIFRDWVFYRVLQQFSVCFASPPLPTEWCVEKLMTYSQNFLINVSILLRVFTK